MMYMRRHICYVYLCIIHTYTHTYVYVKYLLYLMKIYIIYKWRHMYNVYLCITTCTYTYACVKCMLNSLNVYTTYMCKHISYMYLSVIHTYTNTYVHQYICIREISITFAKRIHNIYVQTYILYAPIHEWSGEGLQHLLGATKREFSARYFMSLCFGICNFSKIFWTSDYRQRFPFKSTDIWRYRIQPFCVLSFHLQF